MTQVLSRFTDAERRDAGEMFADTYADCLTIICHKFTAKYRIPFDDLYSDACELYLKAYKADGYDPAIATFKTWLNRIVWNGLFDLHCRPRTRRVKVYTRDMTPDLSPAKQTTEWTPETFARLLSQDARDVLRLVLNTPDDLYDAIQERGGAYRNIRGALRSHLRALGWATERISESYHEIMVALGE